MSARWPSCSSIPAPFATRVPIHPDAPRANLPFRLVKFAAAHLMELQAWKDYQYEFRAKDVTAGNMIQFLVGERTGTVWIADFTLTKDPK